MSQEIYRKKEKEENAEEKEIEEGATTTVPTSRLRPQPIAIEGRHGSSEEESRAPEIPLIDVSPPLNKWEAVELYEISTVVPRAAPYIIIPEIPFSAIKPMQLEGLALKKIVDEFPLPFDIQELIDMVIGAWPQLKEFSALEIGEILTVPPEPLDTPSRMMKLIERRLHIKSIRRLFKRPRPFIRVGKLAHQIPKARGIVKAKPDWKGPEEGEIAELAGVGSMRIPRPRAWEVSLMGGVLEEAFNIKVEGRRIGLSVLIDRPCVILAEKPEERRYEYIEFLKSLLRELYRIRIRGLPSPRHITRRGLDRESLHIKAGKHIYVIDVDEVLEFLEKEGGKEEILDYIEDRLRELFSQGYGFLIFYGREVKLREIRGLLTRVVMPLKPIEIRPVEHDAIFNIVSLMWGSVKHEWPEPIPELTLNLHTARCECEFYDALYKIANSFTAALLVKPGPEPEEGLAEVGESLTHYAVKAFVVRYFMEKEKVPADNIETEYKLGNVIVDVLVDHPTRGRIIVEVETLYGTGLPLTKLVETIESRADLAKELWIVIPNPQAMLFLNHIIALREYCKRHDLPVEFYTLDIGEGELKPITELKRIADDIHKSIVEARRKKFGDYGAYNY